MPCLTINASAMMAAKPAVAPAMMVETSWKVRLPTNGTIADPPCQYRRGHVRRINPLGPLVFGTGQTLLDPLELLFPMMKLNRWGK